MTDRIRVLPDDIERDARSGKRSDYRYRRFHIRSIDAWGVARYSRVVELAGRDAQVWIARYLESCLATMSADAARRWIEAESPVHVPASGADPG
jgi:hypothetical protein